MKKLLYILLFVPFALFGQSMAYIEQDLTIELPEGWSMFGYTCLEPLDVAEAFSGISDNIELVKDDWGLTYLPSYGFSALDNLEFGKGYQIKMIEGVTDFSFCSTLVLSSEEDNEPSLSFSYGTYNIVNWTQDGEPMTLSPTSFMNMNSDGTLTIDAAHYDVVDGLGDTISIYNQDFHTYNTHFKDSIYITNLSDGSILNFAITINESNITLSGTFESNSTDASQYRFSNNMVMEVILTPTPTIPGCMNPNNPAWNADANKNDSSCIEGCFYIRACNYGEEGAECIFPSYECDGSGCDCLDECGIPFGDNSSCTDCAGVVNGVSEDLGCGCGIPGPIESLDCNGDSLPIYQVGDYAHGGIVFYIDSTRHGLVAAIENYYTTQSNPSYQLLPGDIVVTEVWEIDTVRNFRWCSFCFGNYINGADGWSIGTGYQNTLDLVNKFSIAKIAYDAEINGYNDWFLPSMDELDLMYNTIGQGADNAGGFANGGYWSSTQHDNYTAWASSFLDNDIISSTYSKNNTLRARFIRAF